MKKLIRSILSHLKLRHSTNAVSAPMVEAKVEKPGVPPRMTASSRHEDSGFRAGASVAFVTPIGAYAGIRPQNDEIRKRAEQQFYAIDNTSNMTMN